MTISTAVKWAVSSMTGAPTLNGTAGSLIAVLDAFLVNGFGTKAVDSAVVTNGICRLAITGASAAVDHCVIQLAGVTGSGAVLNGLQRVKTAAASYVEFACDLPDGPLTGTITFKIAPLGWEKVFSQTNIAVYRSTDVSGTRCYLRVDDTGATNARVVGYESMSDAMTGYGRFPTDLQVPGGGYWPKANAAGAAGRFWAIFGDTKGFKLLMHTASTASGVSGCVWGFGDFASLRSGDTYACALHCANTDVAAATAAQTTALEYASPAGGGYAVFPRSFTGVGSSVLGAHGVESFLTGSGVAGTIAAPMVPAYPNGAGNALVLSRKVVAEAGVCLRGRVRGLYVPVQVCHTSFATGDVVNDAEGRVLMAVKCGSPAGVVSQGVVFIDILGPWS